MPRRRSVPDIVTIIILYFFKVKSHYLRLFISQEYKSEFNCLKNYRLTYHIYFHFRMPPSKLFPCKIWLPNCVASPKFQPVIRYVLCRHECHTTVHPFIRKSALVHDTKVLSPSQGFVIPIVVSRRVVISCSRLSCTLSRCSVHQGSRCYAATSLPSIPVDSSVACTS